MSVSVDEQEGVTQNRCDLPDWTGTGRSIRSKVSCLCVSMQVYVQFMDMVADRFARLEQENAQLHKANLHLQQQLDLRAPSLFLIPDSRYMQFSDGSYLEWVLFDPTGNLSGNPFSEPFDPTMVIHQGGTRHEALLDEAHWNAVVFPTSFWLNSRIDCDSQFEGDDLDTRTSMSRVFVSSSSSGGPVLLRDFVGAVKPILRQMKACGHTCGGAMHWRVWNGLVPVQVAKDFRRYQLAGLQMLSLCVRKRLFHIGSHRSHRSHRHHMSS